MGDTELTQVARAFRERNRAAAPRVRSTTFVNVETGEESFTVEHAYPWYPDER